MKRFAALGFVVMLLLTVLVLTVKPAEGSEACVINVVGAKVCGKLVDQPQPEVVRVTVTPPTVRLPPLPPVTVTPPPVTLPPVRLPGPTVTATETVRNPLEPATIYRDREPRRILVPGPTSTETVTVMPGPTAAPTETERVTAQGRVVTETVTATETVTRQPTPRRDRVSPDEENNVVELPPIRFPEVIGIGSLIVLALLGLAVFAMWAGYILGYKDADRANADFLRALRDKVSYRGKHKIG